MLEIAVPAREWPELGLKPKEAIVSVPDRVQTIQQQHLCEGSWSPASSILSQLAMGKKYNKIHQSPANIHWSEDEQTIYYKGEPVHLGRIETMYQRLASRLQALMQSLTFDSQVPAIDFSSIIDSIV
jgi:hypothetical protein